MDRLDRTCLNCGHRWGDHFGDSLTGYDCPAGLDVTGNPVRSDPIGSYGYWSGQDKVKVGQVWATRSGIRKYQVSHLVGNEVWMFVVGGDPKAARAFGNVDDDGYPAGWVGWYVEPPVIGQSKVTVAKAQAKDEDLEFFKRPSQPGYCVCNIPKDRCDYHR